MEKYDKLSNDLSTLSLGAVKKEKPTRVPKCTRCNNHGRKVQLKYHKRNCQFRYCVCVMCIKTTDRQRIMKHQTAKRRERQKNDALLKMMKFKEEGKSSTPSLSESNDNSNTESCRSVNGLQLPPQTQPPSLSLAAFSHTSSPAAAILEPELYSEQSEILLGYSRHLLEQYGHSLDPVTMMYVILKLSKNIEVALVSLNQGYLEIQATKKYMAMRNPNWDLYNQGFPRPLSHPLSPTNLGQPTYFPEVPYMGLASSPRTSGLGLLQYPLGTHVFMSKVSSSPDSPPERSSSYPETAHTDESRPRSESVRKSFERCKSGLL